MNGTVTLKRETVEQVRSLLQPLASAADLFDDWNRPLSVNCFVGRSVKLTIRDLRKAAATLAQLEKELK